MYIIWHRTPSGDKSKLCFNQLHLDVHKTKNKLTKLKVIVGFIGFLLSKDFHFMDVYYPTRHFTTVK